MLVVHGVDIDVLSSVMMLLSVVIFTCHFFKSGIYLLSGYSEDIGPLYRYGRSDMKRSCILNAIYRSQCVPHAGLFYKIIWQSRTQSSMMLKKVGLLLTLTSYHSIPVSYFCYQGREPFAIPIWHLKLIIVLLPIELRYVKSTLHRVGLTFHCE